MDLEAIDALPPRLARLDRVALPGGGTAFVATGLRSRLLGLAGLDDIPDGCALLIPRCSSVHTFGMRFDLDVEFLDRDGRVLRRVEAVPPRRLLWCRGAAAVLERKAGAACEAGLSQMHAILDIRVQPRAARNEIAGERAGRLLVRVTAPPVDGKANAAVCKAIAKALGVPKGSVTVVRGQSSRDKTVRVEGISQADLGRMAAKIQRGR